MKSFRDYLGLSNSCSYDIDDVISRADRFGFQNFCSPVHNYAAFLFLTCMLLYAESGSVVISNYHMILLLHT